MRICIAHALLLPDRRIDDGQSKRPDGPPAIETVNSALRCLISVARTHMAAVNPDRNRVSTGALPLGPSLMICMISADCVSKSHVVTSSSRWEFPGVYWIPATSILERAASRLFWVNARYAKNVPGRKTDVSDVQLAAAAAFIWAFLRGSFRPTAERLQRCGPYAANGKRAGRVLRAAHIMTAGYRHSDVPRGSTWAKGH